MIVADPNNPKGIVWLASYPKSGNTWLRVFLYHLVRLAHGHPREDDEINKLDRASTYEGRLYGLFEQFLGKPLATATHAEVTAIRPQVHAAIAERSDSVALVKTHNVLGQLAGTPIINLAVSAGMIYVVRDPRDIVPSLAAHLNASFDETIKIMATPAFKNDNTTEAAFEIWGTWSEHVFSWTGQPHEAVIVVRYEDLLDDPVKHFTAIARHLGQTSTPEQIAEAIDLSTFDKLRAAEDERDFRERSERATRFFRSGRAGGWRDELTAEQAQRVVTAHHQQMRNFGYLN